MLNIIVSNPKPLSTFITLNQGQKGWTTFWAANHLLFSAVNGSFHYCSTVLCFWIQSYFDFEMTFNVNLEARGFVHHCNHSFWGVFFVLMSLFTIPHGAFCLSIEQFLISVFNMLQMGMCPGWIIGRVCEDCVWLGSHTQMYGKTFQFSFLCYIFKAAISW